MLSLVPLLVLAVAGEGLGNLLVADPASQRMIELRGDSPTCTLHTDSQLIGNMLRLTDPRRVKPASSTREFNALMHACRDNDLTSNAIGTGSHRQTGFIYPGTKWCGPGSTASSFDDLGFHRAEDECCREHDHCPDVLGPGQCSRGLCNSAIYTKSHCDCDARFRRCLHNISSETANLIGYIFFNVVQVTCFKEKRPCYSEDVIDPSGRCRNRFHVMSRYAEKKRALGSALGLSGRRHDGLGLANLLSAFLPFRR